MNTDRKPNNLINESSPYLLQHAYNPVNWYPWGEEAFSRAKAEDKPIFLSIGYSTCHWCHVMEGESFEQDDVAEVLNKDYISIKVDKEERPDIDSIYMTVCQAFTGQGGWPMTIIMTPEQKPFYAGTYLPKSSRYPMTGLLELLDAVTDKWNNNKSQLLDSGDEVTAMLQKQPKEKKGDISIGMFKKALSYFQSSFDKNYGGFGTSPKFPTPHNLLFLLRYYHFEQDETALHITEKTLQQMYRGGIFDHIGYGFSRYSTDKKWLVPHFEKMLYDNALLTLAYTDAYQITKNELYKSITVKTLEYINRELTDKDGGFYCAQDADSEGVEGKYYVFKPAEIIDVLGNDDGEYFNEYYNITDRGNFEGANIPNLIDNDSYTVENNRIDMLSPKLLDYRSKRTHLHKDDKILTSWNSLMIAAYARACKVLGDTEYLTAAEKAMTFIEQKLTDDNGNLYVSYREGKTSGNGNIDDYAFAVFAYLELYDTTFDINFLDKALKLNHKMLDNFWDDKNGGFFIYGNNSEQLISRPKELYDGAIPSGNSIAAYDLSRLAKLTGSIELKEKSDKQMSFIAGIISDFPAGYSFFLTAEMQELYPSKEIVITAKSDSDLEPVKQIIRKKFLPNTVFTAKTEENEKQLEALCEYTKAYKMQDNETTFYLCENNSCSPPFHGADELEKRV